MILGDFNILGVFGVSGRRGNPIYSVLLKYQDKISETIELEHYLAVQTYGAFSFFTEFL